MAERTLHDRCNRMLDAAVRPRIRLLGRAWPAYGFFVHAGGITGIGLVCLLAAASDLSVGWALGAAAVGVVAAVTMSLATSVLTGFERYTWYHYHLMLLLVCGGVLHLAGEPVLPYLDMFNVALLWILAVGRVGCLLGGCCHGMPHAWGVRYRAEHVETGFRRSLVGVRLFPTQALEALGILVILVFSIPGAFTMDPGAALALSTVAYAGVRSVLEIWRGDGMRGCFLGVSEAQWTGVFATVSILAAGAAGWLPVAPAVWLVGGLLIAGTVVRMARRPESRVGHAIVTGHRFADFADVVHLVTRNFGDRPGERETEGRVYIGTVPRTGVQLSASRSVVDGSVREHFALASERGSLPAESAERIARLLARLRPSVGGRRLVRGERGVLHLVESPGES